MMMENEFFMIVQILEINHKIINEGNKYSNVLHICTLTQPPADICAHDIYIYIFIYTYIYYL